MLITLHGEEFAIVELDGAPAVIVRQSARMWRVARPGLSDAVLAGLRTPVVGVSSTTAVRLP
jgi:hypothetical protein